MRDLSTMTRQEKVMLIALAAFQKLKDTGLIEGGKYTMTDEGMALFEEIKASGFVYASEELTDAVRAIIADAGGIE